MISIPEGLRKLTQQVEGSGDWPWGYEIVQGEDVATLTRWVWRLTTWSEEIDVLLTDPVTGAQATKTFYPYGILHRELSQDGEGSQGVFEIEIDNTLRQIGRYLERAQGYRDMRVRVLGFNAQTASTFGPHIERLGYVQDASLVHSADASSLVLQCSAGHNLQDRDLPHQTFDTDRCRHRRYGGGRCGMIVTASTPAELRSCPGHWAACIERRDWMRTQDLPELLPNRWGAQPGMPAERR